MHDLHQTDQQQVDSIDHHQPEQPSALPLIHASTSSAGHTSGPGNTTKVV